MLLMLMLTAKQMRANTTCSSTRDRHGTGNTGQQVKREWY
jgi:hypothetical protein